MAMKVQNVNRSDSGLYPLRGPDSRAAPETEQTTFRRTLTNLSKEMHDARIKEMIRGIDEQGARLSDKVDVTEYEKYRRLIREFLDEIVSNGYTFSREDYYASRGRRRFIATVQIVDQKLDELGKEVMKEQADKLEVISRVDDIRGLLLDMML